MKEYFYVKDGQKIGPFSFEELCKECITPETLVWFQGMPEWKAAGEIEEFEYLFSENRQPAPPPVPDTQTVGEVPVQPKSWLVESILATILCCLPFGIAGIVYASKVESRFLAGDIHGAQEASKQAARWTKYSFIAGIIYIVIALIYGIATGFGGY